MHEKEAGTVILVKENEEIRRFSCTGMANIENNILTNELTNFRMASVSKQFTAACIILLKNEGLLRYSDTISTFYPNFMTPQKVTIKHLLTHTSGLIDYEMLITKSRTSQIADAEVLKWVGEVDSLYFEPGTKYKYSNSAFCILSQIVEKVSGQSYAKFLNKRIFVPLEMYNSYVYEANKEMKSRALGYAANSNEEIILTDQNITTATQGDGCVYTSINDYQKWIEAIGNNTLFNLKKELSEVNYPIYGKIGLYYGLGWFNYNSVELCHTGSTSGFSNVVWMSINGKNAIVYFSNLANHHFPAYTLPESLQNVRPILDFKEILELTD